MGEAGEAGDAGDDGGCVDAERARRGVGRGGVLPVVPAGEPRSPAQLEHPPGGARRVVDEPAFFDIDAAARASLGRDRHYQLRAGTGERVGDAAAEIVVDADDRRLRRLLTREDAALGGDVAVHAAVALEMVRRDVEQDGDVEGQALRQLELIGAHLQHIDAVGGEGRERQRRRAEIAADRHLAPGLGDDMADQRSRRRFAVGAGDADIARVGAALREQLDVADDLGAGGAGARGDGIGLRIGVRDAGREDERGNAGEVAGGEIDDGHACRRRGAALGGRVVPGHDAGAAALQRLRRDEAGAGEAHDGHLLAPERRHVDHAPTAASGWRARRSPGSRR